jgi:hypothetical protein
VKTVPNVVLGSSKSSTYPRGYASGFDSPAALLDDRFDKPARNGENDFQLRSLLEGILHVTHSGNELSWQLGGWRARKDTSQVPSRLGPW